MRTCNAPPVIRLAHARTHTHLKTKRLCYNTRACLAGEGERIKHRHCLIRSDGNNNFYFLSDKLISDMCVCNSVCACICRNEVLSGCARVTHRCVTNMLPASTQLERVCVCVHAHTQGADIETPLWIDDGRAIVRVAVELCWSTRGIWHSCAEANENMYTNTHIIVIIHKH